MPHLCVPDRLGRETHPLGFVGRVAGNELRPRRLEFRPASARVPLGGFGVRRHTRFEGRTRHREKLDHQLIELLVFLGMTAHNAAPGIALRDSQAMRK